MAAGRLGKVGEAQNKVSGTTLAVPNTSGAIIPAGTTLYLALTFDNHASATASTVALSNAGGAAWANGAGPIGSGVTTTAGAGIWQRTFYVKTTADIAVGATITTITFGSAVVGKAAVVTGYSGVDATLRGNIVTGVSTAGTPSVVTAGTALVAGDVVVGAISGENNAVPTGDADTLNGSWSAIAGITQSGGAANTNVAVGIQDKIVTATGAQTYNPTTANDSVASVLALVPTPPPTAPTSAPTVAAGADKVTVTTPATLQGNATSYKIYRGATLVASGRGANTAFDDTGASVLATQTYTVRGTNVGGDSADGPASSAVAANPGPPVFGLAGGDTKVTVNITKKSYTAVYKVYRGPSGGARVLVHTSASLAGVGAYSWDDTGLTNGNTYDYHVITSVAAPTSRDSAASGVLPATANPAPDFLVPDSDISAAIGWSISGEAFYWSAIDEMDVDLDGAYAETFFDGEMIVGLSNPLQSQSSTSDVDIHIGYATDLSGTVTLRQGIVTIASFPLAGSSMSLNEDVLQLTSGQVAAITDWTTLRLVFESTGSAGSDGFRINYAYVTAMPGGPVTGPTVTVWNGSAEVPATIEGVWNGSVVVPMASIEVT